MCPEHAFIFGHFLLSTKVRPKKGGVLLSVGVLLNNVSLGYLSNLNVMEKLINGNIIMSFYQVNIMHFYVRSRPAFETVRREVQSKK